MNPRHLPPQIRKDIRTAMDILASDIPCNPLMILAAAALLEDAAAQVRTALAAAPQTPKPAHKR